MSGAPFGCHGNKGKRKLESWFLLGPMWFLFLGPFKLQAHTDFKPIANWAMLPSFNLIIILFLGKDTSSCYFNWETQDTSSEFYDIYYSFKSIRNIYSSSYKCCKTQLMSLDIFRLRPSSSQHNLRRPLSFLKDIPLRTYHYGTHYIHKTSQSTNTFLFLYL